MSSKHLIHFAMVHDEFAKSGDILKGILPLFTPILAEKIKKTLSVSQFCESVQSFYGIHMHPYVAEEVLKRLCAAGNVEQVDAKYKVIGSNGYKCASVEKEFHSLIKKFEEEGSKILIRNGVDVKGVDWTYELSSRLVKKELSAITNGNINKKSDLIDYFFSRFVIKVEELGGKYKEMLHQIYSGAIFSEVVLSLKEASDSSLNPKGVKFYIDAPIILNILGFSDEYSVSCSRQLVEQISELGGVLTTTDSYIDEVELSIKLTLENHINKGYRVTSLDRYIFNNERGALKLRSARGKVKNILAERYGFNLASSLTLINKLISTKRAEEVVDSVCLELSWYKNENSKLNDAKAVAYVVAHHGYSAIKNICESKSFLVTDNDHFVRSANKVLRTRYRFSSDELTPVQTDRNIAMILWVLKGGQGKDISTIDLLGACTQVMEAHRDIVADIGDFISSLNDEDKESFEDIIKNERALYCLVDHIPVESTTYRDQQAILIEARDSYFREKKEYSANLSAAMSAVEEVRAEKEVVNNV